MAMHKGRYERRGIFGELMSWIVYIMIIFGLTYLIITYVGQRTRVSGHSMETTLSHGDNLIVDKLTYRFKEPKRYDIIVFPYKYEENVFYIKRIVGLPGETVQVVDGYTYILTASSWNRTSTGRSSWRNPALWRRQRRWGGR